MTRAVHICALCLGEVWGACWRCECGALVHLECLARHLDRCERERR